LGVFGEVARAKAALAIDVTSLNATIGELTLENHFLSGALGKAGVLASAR
jgi:transposase